MAPIVLGFAGEETESKVATNDPCRLGNQCVGEMATKMFPSWSYRRQRQSEEWVWERYPAEDHTSDKWGDKPYRLGGPQMGDKTAMVVGLSTTGITLQLAS